MRTLTMIEKDSSTLAGNRILRERFSCIGVAACSFNRYTTWLRTLAQLRFNTTRTIIIMKIIRHPIQGLSGAVQYNVNQLNKKTNSNMLKSNKTMAVLHIMISDQIN